MPPVFPRANIFSRARQITEATLNKSETGGRKGKRKRGERQKGKKEEGGGDKRGTRNNLSHYPYRGKLLLAGNKMLNTARTCAENTFITAANLPNGPFHGGGDNAASGHPTFNPCVRHMRGFLQLLARFQTSVG